VKVKSNQIIIITTNQRKSVEEQKREGLAISLRKLLSGENFIREQAMSQDNTKNIHLKKPRKK
jgi:hypothetical protein